VVYREAGSIPEELLLGQGRNLFYMGLLIYLVYGFTFGIGVEGRK
jgi:hypothetical protein